jgi:hypothetical protein
MRDGFWFPTNHFPSQRARFDGHELADVMVPHRIVMSARRKNTIANGLRFVQKIKEQLACVGLEIGRVSTICYNIDPPS